MKKTLLLITVLATLNSCGSVTDNAEEAIAEKLTSELLGADIDVENYSEESQAATVVKINLSIDGEEVFQGVEDFQPVISAQKELLAIQLADETDGNVMLGLQGKDLYAKKPMVGYAKEGPQMDNEITCTLMLNKANSAGKTTMYMLKEGKIRVKEFSKKTVVLEINGTISELSHTTGGENKKNITGKISLENPIMTSMGMKLDEILY